MRRAPRFFSSELGRSERRVYGVAAAFFLLVFLAVTWPVYALFAEIEPRVLGLPMSLAWIVGWVLASFVGLLALYVWERGQRGRAPGDARGERGRAPGGAEDGTGRAPGDVREERES